MARFCFYCGRALANGEKCDCRTQDRSAGSSSGDAAGGSARAAESAGGSQSTGNRAAGNADRTGRSGKAKTGWQQGAYRAASGRPQRARPFNLNGASLRAMLYSLGQYIVRPVESVRLAAAETARQPVLLVLILQGAAGGLFLLASARQTIMQALLALNISTAQTSASFINSLFIFIQGFGISLAASLLVALLYHLAMRFLFHQPAGFLRLLAALSPAFLYSAIFLFAAFFTLAASIFNAAMLILVGFAIAALLHFLALRQISGMDDNRVLTLVIFVLVLFTGILAMLLNLSLPVLRILADQSVTI
jgi:hypothetical protein